MSGVEIIREERDEQLRRWGEEHDLIHDMGELARAAAVYALPPAYRDDLRKILFSIVWPIENPGGPWSYRPGARIHELAKAGALIAAEIDRLLSLPAEPASQEVHRG